MSELPKNAGAPVIDMATEPKIVSLYKGTVQVKFYPDSHQYWVSIKGGPFVRKSGVTSKIDIIDKSRALIPWAVDCFADYLYPFVGKKLTEKMILEGAIQHETVKKEAATIGKTAHEWIDQFVKGSNPDMPADQHVLNVVNGFLQFADEHKLKVDEAEQIVYSKKHDYIGQLDARVRFGNKKDLFVLDHKASNGLYPGVAYQTAAYLKADEEESGRKYAGRWAIRYAKETDEDYYIRQEKKLKKWLIKNPGKSAYQIPPYVPFEARFLDDDPRKMGRDYRAFLLTNELSPIHSEVDKEFFENGK